MGEEQRMRRRCGSSDCERIEFFYTTGFDLEDYRGAKFLKGEELPGAQLIYFRNSRGACFRAVQEPMPALFVFFALMRAYSIDSLKGQDGGCKGRSGYATTD